ncbi:hypothetical protein BD833_103236 [Blastococcus xanthinilyticus]|uniref:Uncharacterized protein n=2 Tax=Blastococcus xanthinilyticus TaxID=1564164 RepID=A0A5S5D381_9ACTN|nr:hypothetical protein BD833_103236 [Blastococcus xanthinilyticus]
MLLIDNTDTRAIRNWQELGVLSSIGYTGYSGSSEHLSKAFAELRPHERTDKLWEDLLVAGGVRPREPRTIFYLPVGTRGDAGKTLDRTLLARKNLSVNTADEEVQGLAPLSWYVGQIYSSSAAIVHLRAPSRQRAAVHNARASLFAGMAAGLGLPTLLVAEEGFEPPLDYRDLLYIYPTAKQLGEHATRWLDELPALEGTRAVGRKKLTAELPRFGEYVAENEQDALADYFVETGQYEAVLSSTSSVFVGRKGTGKTANMLTAAESLAVDKRNLVTVIKPSGYELEGLVAVLTHLPKREVADYLLDGLWRYMLLTEIASSAVREAEGRPAGIATGSDMDRLRTHMEEFAGGADLNFALRLERLLDELLPGLSDLPEGVEDAQAWLSGRLHGGALADLRAVMGRALRDRQRVALLIDNLDKAWERGADRELQSRMILGLLSAVGRVEKDFRREDAWRAKVNVTLAVFLRADIFDVVRQHAREPDKIKTLQVQWDDQELLARLIEDRYEAHRGGGAIGSELWTDFFCPEVRGMPTRDYLLWRSLPRPRDLVYLCNSCVLTATNRRHNRIEEGDVARAEEDYSRFALDALRVEGSASDDLDDVLLEFAGADSAMPLSEVMALLEGAVSSMTAEEAFSRLLRANFLGIEVRQGEFDYPVTDQGEKKARVLAARLGVKLHREAYVAIHPAFRPYLGVLDAESERSDDQSSSSGSDVVVEG